MTSDRRNSKPIIILYDEDREQLTKDVLACKQDADFKPKYVIAPHSKQTQERPQEFKGGFEEWIYKVKELHIKALAQKELLEKQQVHRKFVISVEYGQKIMNKFMKVM